MISYNVLQKSLISLKYKKYSYAKYFIVALPVSIRSVAILFDSKFSMVPGFSQKTCFQFK